MEVGLQTRRFKRHALTLSVSAFLLAVGGGTLLVQAPALTADIARALVTPSIKITPSSNGFAKIDSTTEVKASTGLGQSLQAGSRMNTQFELQSAANRQ